MSLLGHSLATGLAARVLLEGALSRHMDLLANSMRLSAEAAVDLASALVALHDLGKATPGFQALWPLGAERVRARGLPFPAHPIRTAPHAFVTAGELASFLTAGGWRRPVAHRLAAAVGAHHGTFPRASLAYAEDGSDPRRAWLGARQALIERVVAEIAGDGLPVPPAVDDLVVALLAGLTTFADWLASDREVLGEPASGRLSRAAVEAALAKVPLERVHDPVQAGFTDLFEFVPRGAQIVIDRDIAPQLGQGVVTMVIVEDATGAGKTEAAFQLVHSALSAGARGAYVALPTRATSNQAYTRLAAFLAAAMPGVSQAHLLHSSALMTADYRAIRDGTHRLSPREVGVDGEEAGAVEAAGWFCRSKRGLLSPFAVGTVDQAMLGVLQSRFATLRLSGLAGKVLVLDEVHAYDSYMLAIIERLVSWAAAMGTSVVLMSATLPSAMKQRLVRAFGDKHLTEEDSRAYPSVTWVERGSRPRTVRVEPADVSRRSVGLDRVAMHDVNDPGGVCSGLVRDAVAAEANVLVILNTVRRAQDAYGLLADEVGAERVLLLHARYRQVERERRERQVLDAYGRTGERPRGSLVVATQVIEQSLDVDFDLVVSDVAPVDLLLQRIGRLQRHARAGTRPAGYDEARCRLVLLDPPVGDGVPTPDAGTLRVYHEHAVLRTLVALAGRTAIAVPDDVRLLVEAVYDDRGPPDHLQANLAERWRSSARDLAAELTKSTAAAGNRIVGAPGDGSIDTDLAGTVGDDDRPVQGSLAQTRLGVSCPLVVLDAREAADLAEADPRVPRVAQDLLDRSLAVSQPALAYALFDEPVPAHWRRVPLLARHRLVVLDDDGRKRLGSAVMNMDRERGLVVDWERK